MMVCSLVGLLVVH
jgi:hypothetical protein